MEGPSEVFGQRDEMQKGDPYEEEHAMDPHEEKQMVLMSRAWIQFASILRGTEPTEELWRILHIDKLEKLVQIDLLDKELFMEFGDSVLVIPNKNMEEIERKRAEIKAKAKATELLGYRESVQVLLASEEFKLASEEIKAVCGKFSGQDRMRAGWNSYVQSYVQDNMDVLRSIGEIGERIKAVWGKFSAEDRLRAGWKPSDMERFDEVSLFVRMKKAMELEDAYVMRRRRKEAQEKGLLPETEKDVEKSYLWFRNSWIATHSCWQGEFEYITNVRAMGYTDGPVPRYIYNRGPPDTLQIFSVKVGGKMLEESAGPLQVFGLIAVRDSIDQFRNVIFNRSMNNCQTLTKQDPYLVLTGPTRAVVTSNKSIPVTIEAEMNVKGTDGSEDKHLIFAAAPFPPLGQFGSLSYDLIGNYGTLEIAFGRVAASVEACVFTRVVEGAWPAGFDGQISAHTSHINHKKIVLVKFRGDVPVSDNGNIDPLRFAVSVEILGELVLSCKAWRGTEAMEGEVVFKAELKGRSYGILKLDSCTLEFLVAWSPIRPVCEELVSMSEMDFA